jgi:hypothetical protein
MYSIYSRHRDSYQCERVISWSRKERKLNLNAVKCLEKETTNKTEEEIKKERREVCTG